MLTAGVVKVVVALIAVSEALALIPGLKSNSIAQLIYYILKAIYKGITTKEV